VRGRRYQAKGGEGEFGGLKAGAPDACRRHASTAGFRTGPPCRGFREFARVVGVEPAGCLLVESAERRRHHSLPHTCGDRPCRFRAALGRGCLGQATRPVVAGAVEGGEGARDRGPRRPHRPDRPMERSARRDAQGRGPESLITLSNQEVHRDGGDVASSAIARAVGEDAESPASARTPLNASVGSSTGPASPPRRALRWRRCQGRHLGTRRVVALPLTRRRRLDGGGAGEAVA
jgi:hypothetical protein